MTYLFLKLLHIACVVAFLGNIATGLFWAARAHRTRDARLIADTFDSIIRSDRLFTMPGVLGIIVTGVAMAVVADMSLLGTGWILWPIVLFVVSGAMFGAIVAPLQRRIADMARAAQGAAPDAAHDATYARWKTWGHAALLAPLGALAIMVMKPSLPAF
jgi:uncharacterized membrane protein